MGLNRIMNVTNKISNPPSPDGDTSFKEGGSLWKQGIRLLWKRSLSLILMERKGQNNE
jgi:hypothetical protein